jgi:uncharacterized membrane protein YsdA (DUF1294 family)
VPSAPSWPGWPSTSRTSAATRGWKAVSLLTFALYWDDKRRATRGAWRTSEAMLHFFELMGGWPGALIAQQRFRHKNRKVSFQVVFWAIVLAHQAFWALMASAMLPGGKS